jgi:isopenicillin N synthase-like dioxygenase
MSTATSTVADVDAGKYTKLRLSSGNGIVERDVLRTPIRDALESEIPIIDLTGIFSGNLEDRQDVAQQIRKAATTNGFMYIKNHGIDESIPEAAYSALLTFFRQDFATKNRANVKQSKYYNGYKPPQSQRINASESIDHRETFSWTYDPVFDPNVPSVGAIPPHIAQYLRHETFHWDATANLPEFKPAIVAYWRACLQLARALVHSFALSLDLPEDFFDAKFSHPDAALALNYYPPMEKPAVPSAEDRVSIGSHTDFQLFTILWQDDAGGLQVLTRDGQWVHAPPVRGTFVVNFADYFQRITNDLYVSTVHRAQNYSGRERISMPFFFGFNRNESCGVLDSCVREGEKKRYEEIGCDEWVRRRVEAMHRTEEVKPAEKEGA